MRTRFRAFSGMIVALALPASRPVGAQDTDLLNQAEDLVHQAWNPGGDPLPDDQRVSLLNQAIELAQKAPQHHVRGHRVQAITDIKTAIFEIKRGDPDHKATDLIRDADSELRTALSIAE